MSRDFQSLNAINLDNTTQKTIYRIALPVPLRRMYDYLPGIESFVPKSGARVLVQFGNQQLVGILIEIDSETNIEPEKLRPVSLVLDQEPLLSTEILEFCQWAANYYHEPVGQMLASAVPNWLRSQQPVEALQTNYWQTSRAGILAMEDGTIPANAKKRRRLLAAGYDHAVSEAELRNLGAGKSDFDKLKAEGWLHQVPYPKAIKPSLNGGD